MASVLQHDDNAEMQQHETRVRPGMAWLDTAGLLAALVLCLALRVVNLHALPIFFDEAGYIRAAQVFGVMPGPSTALLSLNYGAPPLFAWLTAPFTRVIADPLLAARVASAVIGTLALPLVWGTAGALWGRSAAFLAAVLYALSPFVVFYNRLALIDGLVVVCGAAALYSAIQLARHGRGRDSLLLGVCLGAGMLTKIFSASMFLLPLLAVVAAWPEQRRSVRRGACVAALVGLLPFIALLMTPQGGGLLSATHVHATIRGSQLTVIGHQLVTWCGALWLYLTPPVLTLALLGLWAVRHERMTRLVGAWALLGGLPPALVPGAFLAPRYFLYIAVPIIILAARGLTAVAGGAQARLACMMHDGMRAASPGIAGFQPARSCRLEAGDPREHARPTSSHELRRLGRSAVAWAITASGLALVSIPAVQADAALVTRPSAAPLIPFDRWQYVTGWPSGYALDRVVAYLRRREAQGPLTVVSSIYNPPGDALTILMGRDRGVTLTNVDFATLRAHPLRTIPGQPVFLIACRPYGQALHPDPRHLHLVLGAPNRAGGADDLYEVTPQ